MTNSTWVYPAVVCQICWDVKNILRAIREGEHPDDGPSLDDVPAAEGVTSRLFELVSKKTAEPFWFAPAELVVCGR